MNKPNIITEASFVYNHNFCSVDILKNDIDGVEIYEVKSSSDISQIYYDDVFYQYYVLTNLGLNVKKASIVYINRDYIRHGALDIHKLFNIKDVTDLAKSNLPNIKNNIDDINNFMNKYNKESEPKIPLSMSCFDPYSCSYWQYCTKALPKPNVFDIASMKKEDKIKYYNSGLISFNDLKNSDINAKYLEQINFELENLEPKINKEAIKNLMDSLIYPLYFIDYETFQLAVPEYEGTKPYQQLPFQYSLHIIRDEDAKAIEHKEFLAQIDDKDFLRHFAQSMIKDIPDNGSVIIYNNSFEPSRNRELARRKI